MKRKGFRLSFCPLTVSISPAKSSVGSPLNCVETMWAAFKRRWRRQIAKVEVKYDKSRLKSDMEFVCSDVGYSEAILHCADKFLDAI